MQSVRHFVRLFAAGRISLPVLRASKLLLFPCAICAPRRPPLFHPFGGSCQSPYLKNHMYSPPQSQASEIAGLRFFFRPFRMKIESLAEYAKKLTKFSSAKQNFCIASRNLDTYTIDEAGTTDSDCHFSLFGQGGAPPRKAAPAIKQKETLS